MRLNIDELLSGWEFKPGTLQARLVKAGGRRQVLQLRVELGLLQLETTGRPDGQVPHGFSTYFDYLRELAETAQRVGEDFTLDDEQSQEADREFVQFYQRRVCWLALKQFAPAVRDAEHSLAFMDFVRDHSPNEDYVDAHERYRGYVLFHHTQAAAALAAEKGDADGAIRAIAAGLERIEACEGTDAQLLDVLREMQRQLRKKFGGKASLEQRLAEAIAGERYEEAAKLRDRIRRRQ